MKKDNFDLRSYLIENKMTENSRGDVRHQLGKTILDTRILSEMQIPADPFDHHDPEGDMPIDEAMDQQSFITLCREKGYEVDDPRRAILWATMRDQFSDPDKSVLDAKLGVNDANVDQWLSRQDELNTEPDVMEEAGSSKISADSLERLIKRTFGNSGVYSLTFDTGDTLDAEWMESRDDGVLFNQKDLWSLSPEERKKLYDLIKSGTHYTDSLNGPDFLNSAKDLDEASYTDYDDDDDWQDDNLDLDDRGGASLLDLVKGDKKAGRARKAAAADTAADPAMDDDPVDTDAPEIDDPEEEPAGVSDPNAEAQPGLSAQIKYNPNTVEMEMDDQELDQYLSGFRRPQVAVNVLNRAIRTAQNEVNDSIGLKHLYIVLENGFYVTSRFPKGQVIAKVSADQEWRKKNFGED